METMKIVRQSADEIDASSAQVENDAEKTPAELEITWSCGICEISCLTQRTRKYEFELWTNAAQILAEQHLRRKPTLPSDDVNVDFLAVSCGLAGLTNSLRNFVMNSTNFGLLKPVMPNHCVDKLRLSLDRFESTSPNRTGLASWISRLIATPASKHSFLSPLRHRCVVSFTLDLSFSHGHCFSLSLSLELGVDDVDLGLPSVMIEC